MSIIGTVLAFVGVVAAHKPRDDRELLEQRLHGALIDLADARRENDVLRHERAHFAREVNRLLAERDAPLMQQMQYAHAAQQMQYAHAAQQMQQAQQAQQMQANDHYGLYQHGLLGQQNALHQGMLHDCTCTPSRAAALRGR